LFFALSATPHTVGILSVNLEDSLHSGSHLFEISYFIFSHFARGCSLLFAGRKVVAFGQTCGYVQYVLSVCLSDFSKDASASYFVFFIVQTTFFHRFLLKLIVFQS